MIQQAWIDLASAARARRVAELGIGDAFFAHQEHMRDVTPIDKPLPREVIIADPIGCFVGGKEYNNRVYYPKY